MTFYVKTANKVNPIIFFLYIIHTCVVKKQHDGSAVGEGNFEVYEDPHIMPA